ncbi:hypothetical protein [Shimia sp. R9_1]|uniref:spike base protein, RCAP_Rcc01079 family n=1 Tax=Shimia sp. R9_1 TaxID=2821111 RepID=UPI001FFE1F99|nr:hypothetical protein [Shimia sp. R9_1]
MPSPDDFSQYPVTLNAPAVSLQEITPNDSADLSKTTRALNVASSGTVRLTTADGSVATLFVAAGITFPVRATRVWTTGTTATGIIGLS